MRRLAVLAVLLLAAVPTRAQQMEGLLNNCALTVSPFCTPTKVYNLHEKAVLIDLSAGTLSGSLQCQLISGGAWGNIPLAEAATTPGAATFTGSTIIRFTTPCYAIRVALTACTGCTYTAAFRGFGRGE